MAEYSPSMDGIRTGYPERGELVQAVTDAPYTPSYTVVRNNYASSRSQLGYDITANAAFDELDRFLAVMKAEAWDEGWQTGTVFRATVQGVENVRVFVRDTYGETTYVSARNVVGFLVHYADDIDASTVRIELKGDGDE